MESEGCSGWSFFNPKCHAEDTIAAVVGDAIENMANAVMEAFGKMMASLGTMWVHIGTPNLTGTGGSSSITAGDSAPNSANITVVMSYVMWISLAVAIISLLILGGMIATRIRAGEGVLAVGRVGLILGAVVAISAASAVVSGLLPSGPNNAGGAVAFLQSGLWWYMGAAAIIATIIGAARMAWEQRAEPGRETLKGLLTLMVVAGAGVTIVGLLVTAADSFAKWILNESLGCSVETESCFGDNMMTLIALTASPVGGLGALLIIILGLVAILASAFQIVLMVARGGMLVILTGILPLSAAFTNTEMGKSWFKKAISWLTAFILYKPAAAIVYAAAFQLTGTNIFTDDGSGLLAVLTGLMLMLIALFALPALLRFVTPMVGAMAAGAGGAAAMGAVAALPTGAAAAGRLFGSSGEAAAAGGQNGAAGPSGSHGAQGIPGAAGQGPSGAPGASGASQGSGTPGDVNSQASGATKGATSAGGAAAGTSTAGATGAGAAGAGASSAGAAGAGATGAGAAAGPAGLGAQAAADAARGAADSVRSVGEEATGEGGGPDGSQ